MESFDSESRNIGNIMEYTTAKKKWLNFEQIDEKDELSTSELASFDSEIKTGRNLMDYTSAKKK